MITIVMPVSRDDYLTRVFAALELMDCNADKTSLLVIVDGDSNLFVKTRNLVEESKFSQRLCVQYKSKGKPSQYSVPVRRMRIADIHNQLKQYLQPCDYIMGVEDDTLVPRNALLKLYKDYTQYPYAGMIEAVEVGRWGFPIIGAWNVDDIYVPERLTTLLPKTDLEPIDAGGLYCFMTKFEHYMGHSFAPFENVLGPDVNFGIELRRSGMQNYIDWSLTCEHLTKDKRLSPATVTPVVVEYVKESERWRKV